MWWASMGRKPCGAQWAVKDSILSSLTLLLRVGTSSVQFFKESYASFSSHSSHKATLEPNFYRKYSSEVGTKHSTPLLQINDLYFKQVCLVRLS